MPSPTPSKIHKNTAATRSGILDATEAIMREEGYAAVSSRKVALRAGLSSKLVHYHFKTMDHLFLALFNRVEERYFHHLSQTLVADSPLRALWELGISPTAPRMHKELRALATHNEQLRGLIARSSERTRSIGTAIVARTLLDRGITAEQLAPKAVVVILEGVSRLLVSENALGTQDGHAEAVDLVERWIDMMTSALPKAGQPLPANDEPAEADTTG